MCLAVPGKILEITDEDPVLRRGRVSFGGLIKEVSLAYTPEAAAGEYVVVHAGFAISMLDQGEAERTLALLDGLEEDSAEDVSR